MAHERPDRLPELHQAAASWLEQQGLVDDAIRHGLAAGDSLWAARLVERHIDARMLRSEGVTVRRWHQALPIELFSPRPRLCLAQAFVAAAATDVEAIEPSLDAAERALGGAAYEAFEPSVGRAASLLANVPAAIALERATLAHLRGDAEQTSVFARRAHAELRDGEWVLESVIGGYLAVADWLGGRLAAAEHAMASRIDGWLAAGQQTLAAWGYHYLGQVQTAQGRLSAALATYR